MVINPDAVASGNDLGIKLNMQSVFEFEEGDHCTPVSHVPTWSGRSSPGAPQRSAIPPVQQEDAEKRLLVKHRNYTRNARIGRLLEESSANQKLRIVVVGSFESKYLFAQKSEKEPYRSL
jgi:hypothetical protein